MRLLIVEDNEELAGLLAKGLKTAGYEADVLSTIEEMYGLPKLGYASRAPAITDIWGA